MSDKEGQPQQPITYGDVFESVQGDLASQPVTVEDAELMQGTEAHSHGQTPTGGAASAMQKASENNVKSGAVNPDAHSEAAEQGFGIRETIIDGVAHHEQFVGDERVADGTSFEPTFPEVAASKGITIGKALEQAGVDHPDKIVDDGTAHAIAIAETRAFGIPICFGGGVGMTALSAASLNAQEGGEEIKISEVVNNATEKMILDKVVTPEDVEEVQQEEGKDGLVTKALQEAVESNTAANRYLDPHKNQFEIPPGVLQTDQKEEELEQEPKQDHVD